MNIIKQTLIEKAFTNVGRTLMHLQSHSQLKHFPSTYRKKGSHKNKNYGKK